MKFILYLSVLITFAACKASNQNMNKIDQTQLTNPKIKNYSFLSMMYEDQYFPVFLVDKCKNVFLELCHKIETTHPTQLNELYTLTHDATRQLNDLQKEFDANGSEIETAAAEAFVIDFEYVAQAYGFDANIDDLVAPRYW